MQEELIAQHLSVVQLYIVTERQTLFVEGEVWSISLYNDYIYCWERGKEQDMLVQYKLDIL